MNKKNQVKPALIICTIMAALVIVAFVITSMINRNVVKNTKGKMLYTEGSNGAVVVYDFKDKSKTVTSVTDTFVKDASFYSDGFVFISDLRIGYYSFDTKKTDYYEIPGATELLALDSSGDTIAFSYKDALNSYVSVAKISSGTLKNEVICKDVIAVDDVCLYGDKVLFCMKKTEGSVLYEIPTKGGQVKSLIKGEAAFFTSLSKGGDNIFIIREKDKKGSVANYNYKKKKITDEKAGNGDMDIKSIAGIYAAKYIACDGQAYVCNGTNMQIIELGADNVQILDYIE